MTAAPAIFHAWQDGFGLMADFELWHLTADIPGHPEGSTVSRQTLEGAGYVVPAAPSLSPSAARARTHAWHSTRRSMESVHPFAAVSPRMTGENCGQTPARERAGTGAAL